LKPRRALSIVSGLILLALLVARWPGLNAAGAVETPKSQVLTALILSVQDAPVPFTGSDGRTHLVYEVFATNFTSLTTTVEKVEVLGDGNVLQTLDAAAVAGRLQPAGQRTSSGVMPSGTQSLLFVHVILPSGASIPRNLGHRFTVKVHGQELIETGGNTSADTRPVAVIGRPLRGGNYISADSCCDATRHTRAALPVNGRVWVAQRYAVDWEQLDASNRIYVGPRTDVASYKIYGAEILAVAKATVASAVDGLPNQTPGKFPENLPIEEADGNHVILDLGNGNYALYAHLKPGSVMVHAGETVTPGQVIGLVGNSGNTIAPHLHFQLMSRPLSLAANGLPYEIGAFQITAISPGTEAFDKAEADGTPLAIKPVTPPDHVTNALPLDQLIISFGP
jgi:murein DD-endopeptidase MepM/ murein hydrolase activator NlpD